MRHPHDVDSRVPQKTYEPTTTRGHHDHRYTPDPRPAHKQKLGGVRLGVTSAAEASAVAAELGGAVLVAEQVPSGIEAPCGMSCDPKYGPLLAVGLGGAVAEAAGLVAVALAPLDLPAARALVARAPALPKLAGAAALEGLARVLVAVGRLVVEQPSVSEIDLNPVVLGQAGAVSRSTR